MSRTGEDWYSQSSEENLVQKIIKRIKLCFTGESIFNIDQKDNYGSI